MDKSLHRIYISLLIESDYRKRGVFPMLRLDYASKVAGSSIFFEGISMDFVLSLKKDADVQHTFSNRSMKRAYSAISKQMNRIIREPEIKAEKRKREAEEREKFKVEAIKSLRMMLDCARLHLWSDKGYTFDNETLTDVEQAMDKLEQIVEEGRVVHPNDDDLYAPTAQSEVTSTSAYKSDAVLQNFIKAATSDLSLVKNESPEGT